MGQSFYAVIRNRERHYCYAPIYTPDLTDPTGGGCGMKMTEHAYMDNTFVLAVASKLYRRPHRLAWVGDESEPAEFEKNGTPVEAGRKIFDLLPRRDDKVLSPSNFSFKGKFVANHIKKLFLNMDKFIAKYAGKARFLICPLPYLVSVGYGYTDGGIGSWAWDVISVQNAPPTGFAEYTVPFMRD